VIDIPFAPELTLGPLTLQWHGLFTLVGVLAGVTLALRRANVPSHPVPLSDKLEVAIAAVIGGIVGARFVHVIDDLPFYLVDPVRIVTNSVAGLAIIGGIGGGLLGALIALRWKRLPIGLAFDRCTVGLPLGMAIGRIGDLINGEHETIACAGVPWCIRYTDPASVGSRTYVHPEIAYEMLLDLAILAVLLVLTPWASRQRRGGQLAFVFLVLYGAGRFALGVYRINPTWLLGLTEASALSVVLVIVGITGLGWLRRPAR
jgi:phosphatidylglycerol:prolipoprotein diacylglycerol transferase